MSQRRGRGGVGRRRRPAGRPPAWGIADGFGRGGQRSAYPIPWATFFRTESSDGSPRARWKTGPHRHDAGGLGAVRQDHRRPIGVHRRGVVETVGGRIGLVERARPAPGHGPRGRHQGHRRSRARGEGAGWVEQGGGNGGLEPGEPRLVVPAVDEAGPLEDLGEAGHRVAGRVEDRPFLVLPRWFELMIEAGVRGSDPPEAVPTRGMPPAAKVDPPDDRAGRQDMNVRRQRVEPAGRGRARDLRAVVPGASPSVLAVSVMISCAGGAGR